MPTSNKCWAAWNYSIGDTKYSSDITYYMNKLQNIDTEKPILITLNPKREIKESLVVVDMPKGTYQTKKEAKKLIISST